jgi:hypothetical protein
MTLKTLMYVTLLFTSLPLAGNAQNLRCVSQGYCTNDRTCADDSAVFELIERPDGKVDFGWVDTGAIFSAKPIRRGNITLYSSTIMPDSFQTLVVSDTLEATLNVSVMAGDQFYSSLQILTCEVAD